MQNILVSHNYLSLVACTCRAVFGPERGTWSHRWDGVAGDPGSAPVSVTSLPSELYCLVVQHLPVQLPHFILLLTPQTPWGPGIWWPLYPSWCDAVTLQQSQGPRNRAQSWICPLHAPIHALKLLPRAPQNGFGLGQKSLRCRAQQDLSSWSGPRGVIPAQMTAPMPKGCVNNTAPSARDNVHLTYKPLNSSTAPYCAPLLHSSAFHPQAGLQKQAERKKRSFQSPKAEGRSGCWQGVD